MWRAIHLREWGKTIGAWTVHILTLHGKSSIPCPTIFLSIRFNLHFSRGSHLVFLSDGVDKFASKKLLRVTITIDKHTIPKYLYNNTYAL